MPTATAASASKGGRSANDNPGAGFSDPPLSWAMISPAQYIAAAPASHRYARAMAPSCPRAPSHRLTAAAHHASMPSTLILGFPR